MKCPKCASPDDMERGTHDVPYTYKNHNTVFRELPGLICDACDEAVLSKEETEQYFERMNAFKKKVDAEPAYITSVREKLGLNRTEASELFGGGINAFSRYELGKVKPPMGVMLLLEMLDKQPELLEAVRQSRAA